MRFAVGSGAWRIEPDATSPNLIGGSTSNAVAAGVYGATIGGGGYALSMCGSGSADCWNRVTANYGTVGGGYANIASGYAATIGGGQANHATGTGATVGGGGSNTASGYIATVPGGGGNTAGGDYSFAAGRQAKANNQGCFVWGDNSTTADVTCSTDNRWVARAAGGVVY